MQHQHNQDLNAFLEKLTGSIWGSRHMCSQAVTSDYCLQLSRLHRSSWREHTVYELQCMAALLLFLLMALSLKLFLPESGYKHKSLISVDGSMDVNGFPCHINNTRHVPIISGLRIKSDTNKLLTLYMYGQEVHYLYFRYNLLFLCPIFWES